MDNITKLKEMTRFTVSLQTSQLDEHELACSNLYVRIGGDGYRAVSLADNRPLMKYVERGPVKTVSSVERHFDLPEANNLPKKEVPKRRVQNLLIKRALTNGRDLKSALRIQDDVFDQLLFTFDEISLDDEFKPKKDGKFEQVRCDILAIGEKRRRWVPVLIELKSEPNLKDLLGQLDNFSNIILRHHDLFSELLYAKFGKTVNATEVSKMIIWPKPKKGHDNKTFSKLRESRVTAIEYDEHVWEGNDISKIRFFTLDTST